MLYHILGWRLDKRLGGLVAHALGCRNVCQAKSTSNTRMLTETVRVPLVGELTCQIDGGRGLLSPDKCALGPVAVPYFSTEGEHSVLVFFALPSLGFLHHLQRRTCREILLPIPLLELGFVELLPFGRSARQVSKHRHDGFSHEGLNEYCSFMASIVSDKLLF